MPILTDETKRLNSLVEVRKDCLKTTESSARGSAENVSDAPQVRTSSSVSGDGVDSRRKARGQVTAQFVPVQSRNRTPLMPCHPARARELVRGGRAIRLYCRGIFYIRLLDRAEGKTQPVAVGIDPGSKKEGFTVKSAAHTYLNIQADAVQHVRKSVEIRRNMRHTRRARKTPCRANRENRSHGGLPPSTKARWQWKLRIVEQLAKLFPISDIVVEDIKAVTKGKRKWDRLFSPLEVGKSWFYAQLNNFGNIHLKRGMETAKLRVAAGLKKTSRKLSEVFEAHCVDSWVLANWLVGGHIKPDNTRMLCVTPIRLHRRQLHMLQPAKGGLRKFYGGTRSCGRKRGSLVIHHKYGFSYVGGTMSGKISLHALTTGKRLCQNAKPSELTVKAFNTWRVRT